MKVVQIKRNRKPRRIWILILVVLLIAGAGGGYLFWSKKATAAQASTGPDYSTSVARTGNIIISASGSGTLVPAQEKDLSFSTSGTVAEVDVQPGDVVKQGAVLAKLSDLTSLQDAVNSAQQNLIAAQQDLQTLKASAPSNLATAQLNVIDAQKAVTDAQAAVVQNGWAACDANTTNAYYSAYMKAQDYLNSLGNGGGNQNYYLNVIVPQKNIVARAKAAYDACAGYTQYQVNSSHANLAVAQATLKTDQDTLDLLTKNDGINPLDLATAQNKVDNAQMTLQQAQQTLDGATLKAPFDGTILTVAGNPGDTVGSGSFITIADLAHPQVQFSVDETDMDKVAIGETATVSFDAIPGRSFSGKVIRIYPALVTSGGYQVLQGLIQVDLSKETSVPTLVSGLNATVDVVQASANNVLLVPVQALINLGGGQYGVMVVGSGGQPKMTIVQVGLQDAANAEIKSGLTAGQVVTTGSLQTTGSSSNSSSSSSSSGSSNNGSTGGGGGFGGGGGGFIIRNGGGG